MAAVSDEEVYANLRTEVLEDLREDIVAKLAPHKLYSYLRQHRILDAEDQEMIEAKVTRRQKAEKFLDILSTKGPDGFDRFCEGIEKRCTGQLDLLRLILTEFDRRKNDLDPKPFLSSPVSPGDPKMVTQVLLPVSTPQAESHTVLPAADNLPAPGDNVPGVPTPPDELNTGGSSQSLPPPYTEEPPPYTS